MSDFIKANICNNDLKFLFNFVDFLKSNNKTYFVIIVSNQNSKIEIITHGTCISINLSKLREIGYLLPEDIDNVGLFNILKEKEVLDDNMPYVLFKAIINSILCDDIECIKNDLKEYIENYSELYDFIII